MGDRIVFLSCLHSESLDFGRSYELGVFRTVSDPARNGRALFRQEITVFVARRIKVTDRLKSQPLAACRISLKRTFSLSAKKGSGLATLFPLWLK